VVPPDGNAEVLPGRSGAVPVPGFPNTITIGNSGG
jgi:hypothetical protein